MSSVKLKLTKMLLFVSFGLKYIYYSLILFLGVSESCIICFCLILLAFLFVYLYLFGLNRGLKILFGLFWLPKSPLLDMSGPKVQKKHYVQIKKNSPLKHPPSPNAKFHTFFFQVRTSRRLFL